MKYLLEKGADPNEPDNSDFTPLTYAITDHRDHPEIISLLIEYGLDGRKSAGANLSTALADDRVELIKFLLENGADPNSFCSRILPFQISREGLEEYKEKYKYRPFFMEAVDMGKKEVVELLLEKGIRPDVLNYIDYTYYNNGGTTLDIALIRSGEEIVEILEQAGAVSAKANGQPIETYAWSEEDEKAYYSSQEKVELALTAIEKNDLTTLKALIKKGVGPNSVGENSTSLFEDALWEGNAEIIKLLLAHGAKVSNDQLGKAAHAGYRDIVELLIKAGADPEAQYQDDWTDFMLAAAAGDTNQLKALLNEGVYINERSESGTPLLIAIKSGREEAVRFLIENGADAKNDQYTLFSAAVENKNAKVLKYLLENVIELNQENHDENFGGKNLGERSLLEMLKSDYSLSSSRYYDHIKVLLEHGAKPDAEMLRVGVLRGQVDIVKLLLKYGADPQAKDENEKTLMEAIIEEINDASDLEKKLELKKVLTILQEAAEK